MAGVAPFLCLYAAFVMGIISAVISGRPGMISGAMAVVMVAFVEEHGIEYLFAAVLPAGLIQD